MWYRAIERKRMILELLEVHKYLRTGMIAQAVFPASSYKKPASGRQMAAKNLKTLYRKNLVDRTRADSREEYLYFLPRERRKDGKISHKWRHWEAVNRFHFTLFQGLKAWQQIHLYQFEVSYGPGIADGFYVLKTTIDGAGIKFFLEVDLGGNEFNKVRLYNQAYEDRKWQHLLWADPFKSGEVIFPQIWVVTKRDQEVTAAINKQNKNDLCFKITTFS